MTIPLRFQAVILLLVVVAAVAAAHAETGDAPRDVGLLETTSSRLAQLDVSVSGPEDTVQSLTPDDFWVSIGGNILEDFLLDRVCREAEEPPDLDPGSIVAGAIPEPQAPPGSLPATYLFYFDQPHLTMAGRSNAIQIARELVADLVREGNRGSIVSNAEELETIEPMTGNPRKLLDALDRLEQDRSQWVPYASLEEQRVNQVIDALGLGGSGSTDRAVALARRFQNEERWVAEKNLRRFAMVLARLAEERPPKVAVYFADTMRANAGEHYVSFFGKSVTGVEPSGDPMIAAAGTAAAMARLPADRLLEEASAHGIRLYTVEAQGLTTSEINISGGSLAGAGNSGSSLTSIRVRDAQDTMVSLAKETGGAAFLNGIPARKIATKILADLSCLYVLSFDPSGFPQDRPLPVRVDVERPKVRVQTRGQIVIQSEEARTTSQLLSAFADPEARDEDVRLAAGVIPLGWDGNRYRALVQVVVPESFLSGATWDLGASLVSRGDVRSSTSGRVSVAAPGVRIVLEDEMEFAPGPYEVVAVAHETSSGIVASRRSEGEWPKPNDTIASISPAAVLQPVAGVFLRDGETKTDGVLAFGESDPVDPARPTAIVSLVCRARDLKGAVRVETRLVGVEAAPFPVKELEFGDDRCVQIRDVVPSGTLTDGEFRYEILVRQKNDPLARSERRFMALAEGAAAPAGS